MLKTNLVGNFSIKYLIHSIQERKPDPKKLATSKDYHDPAHSLYKPHPIISQKEAANSNFYETSKNYQAQVLNK